MASSLDSRRALPHASLAHGIEHGLSASEGFALLWLVALSGTVLLAAKGQADSYIFITLWSLFCCVVGFAIGKGSPEHPLVWWPFFIWFYHASALVIHYFGILPTFYPDEIARLTLIALIGAWSGALFGVGRGVKETFLSKISATTDRAAWGVYWVSVALIVAENVAFYRSGVTSKADWNLQSSFSLLFAHNWLLAAYLVLLIRRLGSRRAIPKAIVFCTGFIATISGIGLGERDVIYSYIVVTMLAFIMEGQVNKWKVLFVGLILIATEPLLQRGKNLFVRDPMDLQSEIPAWLAIFRGEFFSAGRNLERLLSAKGEWSYSYGTSLVQDVLRGVLPGGWGFGESTQKWFNSTFFPEIIDEGRGYGFTMIGTWYVNFGAVGVLVGFALLTIVIFILFCRRRSSWIAISFYILFVPAMIYSIRGDLSVVLSYGLKQCLLPLLLIVVIGRVLYWINGSKRRENTGRRLVAEDA
ncbi:MAG TPA: O-antigen polysaccharide polymerase Wzy [Burkholderiales bacterium]|nr:O-antigen polysaccharide polymerase Wzy [Burkholderiales bacterium]